MNTVLHYPDGSVMTLETGDYMLIIDSLDSNVKITDTWQKGQSTHFSLEYKTTDEILEDS